MTAHDDRLLGTWNAFLKPQDKKHDENLCPKCGFKMWIDFWPGEPVRIRKYFCPCGHEKKVKP